MVTEDTLVVVLATVLTGVLIFLTFETRFRSVRNANDEGRIQQYADLSIPEGKVTLGMIVLFGLM
jgi:hypothetical protein